MGSAGWWFAAGVIALALIYATLLCLIARVVVADMRETRRRKRATRVQALEDVELGVRWWHPDAEHEISALVNVQRTGVDEVGVYLQPCDGSDRPSMLMPRATAEALGQLLGRARYQEVHHG